MCCQDNHVISLSPSSSHLYVNSRSLSVCLSLSFFLSVCLSHTVTLIMWLRSVCVRHTMHSSMPYIYTYTSILITLIEPTSHIYCIHTVCITFILINIPTKSRYCCHVTKSKLLCVAQTAFVKPSKALIYLLYQ